MATFEVEVIGHYSAVIEVEAESADMAEEEAISIFESDYDVVANQGADSWDHSSIAGVEEIG
jgi:hypothetical protein